MKIKRGWLPIAGVAMASLVGFPVHAAVTFAAPPHRSCRQCESSEKLRTNALFAVPQHGVAISSGSGVVSRFSRAVVVDFDNAETTTYIFRRDDTGKDQLINKLSRTLRPDELTDLVAKAKVAWNPPPPDKMPYPAADMFEIIYVIAGPTMVETFGVVNNPTWLERLKQAVNASEAAEPAPGVP